MTCQICGTCESTARITERQADGSYRETRLCQTCCHETVPESTFVPTPPPSVETVARMISGLRLQDGRSITNEEAARMALVVVDRWGKRNPPPWRPG